MTKRLLAFVLTLILVLGLGIVAHAGGVGSPPPNPPLRPRSTSIELPPIELPCYEDYCNDNEQ